LSSGKWQRGEDKEGFEAVHGMGPGVWVGVKAKIDAGESPIKWDANIIACIEASFKKANWEEQEKNINDPEVSFTLIHGDFHAANMVWDCKQQKLVLLDFEMCGIGSGAIDLGQFMIGHVHPAMRREHEMELLERYHKNLRAFANVPESYTLEKCIHEYKLHSSERYCAFLPFAALFMPNDLVQYVHD
jgi:hypothetical protein